MNSIEKIEELVKEGYSIRFESCGNRIRLIVVKGEGTDIVSEYNNEEKLTTTTLCKVLNHCKEKIDGYLARGEWTSND